MSVRISWFILTILAAASPFAAQGTLYWQFDTTDFVVQPTGKAEGRTGEKRT